MCKKTYLMESGWEIIRRLGKYFDKKPPPSDCHYERVTLNEKFAFTRPLTVTGAYLQNGVVAYHQMTVDRVDNNEYVLQNTDHSSNEPPLIRIPLNNPYFASDDELQSFGLFYEDANIRCGFGRKYESPCFLRLSD
ncbi:Oidioi.mRNA.OKI2018_I69.PAR.g9995.t1.cds [Oikopleura dioica]|uniref:Oidioi.mRNA.OKI2018_I69.PAR.g9995.t1.cds n=1 Tax=Oikopleura dioica TaxID=34765 RepID=A0ABN7RTP5_OIKDI|nr:Oidioi.mRNA.OKI2018_I69.PAR.g9995.t1.cds [Oikopleura dioica]